MFGAQLPLAVAYAERLAGDGVTRGLIGPREVDRLWERHLINSALLAELLPVGASILDVGSGAGLPGIPLAICRPDLRATLLDPMLRRTAFLTEVVADLDLGERVGVIRGRAEEPQVREQVGSVSWLTARAVAPLDRLVEWCLPMLAPGGMLIALKGAGAQDEVAKHRPALLRAGVRTIEVRALGAGLLVDKTWAVCVQRDDVGVQRMRAGRKR
jgi:16S rRNA (guanine527-N7)-methyltransferase